MKEFFHFKNTQCDLRNKQKLKLPETCTSRYGTQALCFKNSAICNMVPNKFKNLDSIVDFKKHLKDWKPSTAVGTCVCTYIVILISVVAMVSCSRFI